MITTFGPRAERYANALHRLDAIVVEPSRLLDGYVEAMRRRYRGESFYGMVLLEENHDRTMSSIAPEILSGTADDDRCRQIFNSVVHGNVVINDRSGLDVLAEPHLNDTNLQLAAREFLTLCPALLVRSQAEYERVSGLFQRRRPYEIVVIEPPLPAIERVVPAAPQVVIWAPDRSAADVSLYAFALAELHGSVTLVSADGLVPPRSTATALRIDDPRVLAALAAASCIVFPEAADPGAAISFARRGYGIVASRASGTHEFVDDLGVYDPSVPRDIYVATVIALGQPASLRDLPRVPPRAPRVAALPVARDDAPPATVIVPTFNRRDDLQRCLSCLAAQTYPNVRAVVANDAGERVDDIVERFPFARLLHLEENGGAIRACMEALKLVTGGFVQFLADDDWLFPDHVERLVAVMLRSGAAVAHSNAAIRYVERLPGGGLQTTGFNVGTFIDTVTPSEAMVSTGIAGNALMWKRSVFDAIGPWRADCALADQEVQLRAAQRFAFAYVDQVTAEWRVHGSNFSGKADSLTEQRRIYEVLHPTPDRPIILNLRSKMLDGLAARPPGFIFRPSLSLLRPETL